MSAEPVEGGGGLWVPTDLELSSMSQDELASYAATVRAWQEAQEHEFRAQPKQAIAEELAGQVDELLYGGAAGGGKTYWLVQHALQEMLNHRNNYGAIFRRVYKSIVGTVLETARDIYPRHGGKWNEQKQRWTFPNGSVLLMSSLEHVQSVRDYQGVAFGFLGFEEVTEFTEFQVTYLIARLRAPVGSDGTVRPHMVATANPGGEGHKWVKRRYVKPKDGDWDPGFEGGERPLPYYVWRPRPTSEDPEPNTRAFVPATLDDNPALTGKDPGYRRRLNQISDPALRKAMKTGDWDAIDAIEGALWRSSDLSNGRVRVPRNVYWDRIGGAVHRVLAIDPSDGNEDGKGDEFGVAVCARGADGIGAVEFSAGWRRSPKSMARGAVQLAAQFACDEIVVERNHGGKWVRAALLSEDPYANVVEVWASEGKVTRARPVAALFEEPEGWRPDSFEPRHRAVLIGEHEDLEEELTTFTGQPGEASPNRLDALVWGMTRVMLGLRAVGGTEYEDERLSGRR